MCEKKIECIGILTSGGDAPGMNAAIRGAVRRALQSGMRVKGIYRGYEGLIDGEIKELSAMDVSGIIGFGGTVLFTARCPEMMTPEGPVKAAEMCRKHGIDALIVIGGDGSFRGALSLAEQGIKVIGIPATIDMDIGCTDYTIGFDTSVNTAMEAIDKVRDTSASHERCSIIEVMGRRAGYLAIWCGIAVGAEDILIPEYYDGNEDQILEKLLENRKRGKKHHVIVNAEGIGDSLGMAKRIEAATGICTRATVVGYMQRGGSPTCRDRVVASAMGACSVDLLKLGKTNVVTAYKNGKMTPIDIEEALKMENKIDEYEYELAMVLSNNYSKNK